MTLALTQVAHTFNARSVRDTVFSRRTFANRWVWGAVLLCVALQLAAVYVPFLQPVLRTVRADGGRLGVGRRDVAGAGGGHGGRQVGPAADVILGP